MPPPTDVRRLHRGRVGRLDHRSTGLPRLRLRRQLSNDDGRSLERHQPRPGAESTTLGQLAFGAGSVLRADGPQLHLDAVRRRNRQGRSAQLSRHGRRSLRLPMTSR